MGRFENLDYFNKHALLSSFLRLAYNSNLHTWKRSPRSLASKKVDFDQIKFAITAQFWTFFVCIYLQIFVNFYVKFLFTPPIAKPLHLSWQWTDTSLRYYYLLPYISHRLPQSNPTCSKALGSFLLTESPSIALPRSVVFPSVVRQVWELVRKVWGSLMDEWICKFSQVFLFCPQSWGSRESKLQVCSQTCFRQSRTPELSYASLRHTMEKIQRFLSQHPKPQESEN